MIGGELRCASSSGLRPARRFQMEMAAPSPPGAAHPLVAVIERAAELLRQKGRELCLEVLELSPRLARRADHAVSDLQSAGPGERCDGALAPHCSATPEHFWAVNELARLRLAVAEYAGGRRDQ